MATLQLILGIALITLGSTMVLGRHQIVANHRRRFSDRQVNSAPTWLATGTVLALAGLVQLLLGLR